MTQTLMQAWSFECGGGQALKQSVLAPIVVVDPAPWHANETYTGKYTWKLNALPKVYTLAGTPWITCTANVRFSDITPTADVDFLRFEDGTDDCWRLRLKQGEFFIGRIELIDANGSRQAYKNRGVSTRDSWHVITVKFKHSNSTAIQVWIDSTLVFSESGFDASHGDTTGLLYMMQNVEGEEFFNTHGLVIEDDGTNMHDEKTYARRHYFRNYQNTSQGPPGDFGVALSTGDWDYAGETPYNDANLGIYDVTAGTPSRSGGIYTDDGARTGPSGDGAIGTDDEIVGALYVSRCRSENHFPEGKRVKFKFHHGSDDSYSSTQWPVPIPGVWNLNSNRQVVLDGADAHCPTTSEYAAIGVQADRDSQDGALWIGELWALVCYREPRRRVCIDGFITTV